MPPISAARAIGRHLGAADVECGGRPPRSNPHELPIEADRNHGQIVTLAVARFAALGAHLRVAGGLDSPWHEVLKAAKEPLIRTGVCHRG